MIGSGGMATVYRAADETLGRTVAVKLFRGAAGADAADSARTASETRTLASLNHHALVTLFDAHINADAPSFLVMEHIDGPTLGTRIRSSPVGADDARLMAIDLADALHTVHAANIVHRDVKPSNILLHPSSTGPAFRAKLADFGIAYLLDTTRVTTPGTLIGTAAYLSPEQVRGEDPRTASDIYSFGLVLIEALTGRRVFDNTGLHETLLARLHGTPTIPEHLGAPWTMLLTAMTTTDPGDRPRALEVADALRRDGSTATATVALPPTLVTAPTLETVRLPASPTESTAATEAIGPHEIARPPRRRLVATLAVIAVIIVAAAIAGILAWTTASGSPAAPALPALPEPLATHLDQLMKDVTP